MDHGMHHGGTMGDDHNMTSTPHKMMMHMTFYWSKSALVLFDGFPGTTYGMYLLSLLIVFAFSMSVEWLSHSQLIKHGSGRVSAGLLQTLLHMIRVGLSYLVMLAVMSFNGGVFLAAVAGHSVGFLVFGSRVLKGEDGAQYEKRRDLPPMTC